MTFHGRDIFAPIAAELAAGRTTPVSIGKATREWTPAWLDKPEVAPGKVSGIVVTVDAFGNLISDIDQGLLHELDNPVVHVAGNDIEILATYGRTEPGEYLALINSFGGTRNRPGRRQRRRRTGHRARCAPVIVTGA